jgi:hypothetical protein
MTADAPSDPKHQRDPAEDPVADHPDGGSGTVGPPTGSYGRDAEQDPALGRDRQAAE